MNAEILCVWIIKLGWHVGCRRSIVRHWVVDSTVLNGNEQDSFHDVNKLLTTGNLLRKTFKLKRNDFSPPLAIDKS